MRHVNINQPEFNLTQEQPGYSWRAAQLGPAIGAVRMGATLYELPPGQATYPYHYEYGCEEWLLLVSGSATLRNPDGDHALTAGDLVCFPEGPDGGHRVVNTGDLPAGW
ncbi:MAG TPA: cupin domain-containing protein [Gaiellales bacterium]|nr:cupin domain-containing protein [Gaiellales bacterium]